MSISHNSENKIITVCGSMHFFKEIQDLQNKLETLGFKAFVPNMEGLDTDYITNDDQRTSRN